MKPSSNSRGVGNALLIVAAAGALLTIAATSLRPSNLACVNNAAMLATAVEQYVQDNDENFPPMSNTPAFQAAVRPYTHSQGVFVCPVTSVAYKPNAALDYTSEGRLGRDPGSVEVVRDGQLHADGLPTIAYLDGHVERGGVDQADPEQACLTDAKQLALAVEQYTQDYDETLPPMHTPSEMQNAILPYLKTQRYFRSPVTGLPFTPNSSLSGQSLNAFPQPAATELLRDPRRHRDGKSVVAYLDGHVVKQ